MSSAAGWAAGPPGNGLPGRLIAVEGIDGCGKSTQAALLAAHVGALLTFEPGATLLGRAIRALALDPDGPGIAPSAEALLMLADRAQHLAEVVEPALSVGRWVVTDRFTGSTLAYQGAGRGLNRQALAAVASWAAGGRQPDLSVLLDLPEEVARSRLVPERVDRLEALGHDFFTLVREGFVSQAVADPEHWMVVDATGTPDTVAQMVQEAVADRLGPPPG